MVETAEQILAVFWLVVAVVALVPLVLFSISYKRVRSKNLLLTTIAFGLIFLKGALLASRLIIPASMDDVWYLDDETWWMVAAVLDIIIIGLISASLLIGRKPEKKSKKK